MDDDLFNSKNTGFWGFLAAFFWSVPKILEYLKEKRNQKANDGLAKALTKEVEVMEEKKGIKETKEVLVASKMLSLLIIKKVKDGIQLQDGVDLVSALLLDAEIKKAIGDAADKVSEVSSELSDLDVMEIVDLGNFALSSVPEYLSALKK